MTITEKSQKWIEAKKRKFWYFNFPIVIGLPLLIYTPILENRIAAEKFN